MKTIFGRIVIKVKTPMLPYDAERLEDTLRDLLEGKSIRAVIEDSITGNVTNTRQRKT